VKCKETLRFELQRGAALCCDSSESSSIDDHHAKFIPVGDPPVVSPLAAMRALLVSEARKNP